MMCQFRTSMGNTMMRRILRNKKASAWRMASQIVTLSGLIPLKSIPQMECIALPYNTRVSTLWTPFDGRIFGCQREPHATTICATSLKLMRVQRLRGQSDYREPYSNDDTINEHYPNR